MEKFNSTIDSLDLLEFPFSNGKFTWSRPRNDSIHSLLDRFFITKAWEELFHNSSSSRAERITFDHFPIFLEVGDFVWDPSPFRFYNSWLKDKDCVCLIESKLSADVTYGWAGFVLHSKLRNLKPILKQWSEKKNQEQRRQSEKITSEISNLDAKEECLGLSDEERTLCSSLQNDLLNIFIEKERVLTHKCKIHWLKEGDENSSFFHQYLAARKRKTMIIEISDSNGLILLNEQDIEEAIIGFFWPTLY